MNAQKKITDFNGFKNTQKMSPNLRIFFDFLCKLFVMPFFELVNAKYFSCLKLLFF